MVLVYLFEEPEDGLGAVFAARSCWIESTGLLGFDIILLGKEFEEPLGILFV
jgi:hypothetical protein